ncbi:NADPH-dependent FMN reductase [Tabrizicola sp.]|uniref:NADPH-dependent FMN reductase n=1 Tax=Tabrizicola sp. TaxID=2005166 RepID=UPI00286D3DBD|nr:NADPH-dependent FMN reductase [Tabrizicola sp.]
MKILALSGSLRQRSGNTALLHTLADLARPPTTIRVYDGLGGLPLFNPDDEGPRTPAAVLSFAAAVAEADALVIACPEYVHAIPGAFKNAIDWLVSRQEIIGKPIALLHASHGGDDVLTDLRRVLATVSDRFAPQVFARLNLRGQTPEAVAATLGQPENQAILHGFLAEFLAFVATPA